MFDLIIINGKKQIDVIFHDFVRLSNLIYYEIGNNVEMCHFWKQKNFGRMHINIVLYSG